jgi:hypothetical protein
MTPLGPLPADTLRALLDRLIPHDDLPGAVEAGVENYLRRFLETTGAPEAPGLAVGLIQLERESAARHDGASFTALTADQQDALLRDIEIGKVRTLWPAACAPVPFFTRMIELAHEGFYADPANGGNQDAVSWRMIGYDRGIPSDLGGPPHA